jgi:RNA polymerase sigma factor (sigma-70 family)
MAISGELDWFLTFGTREPLLRPDEEITLAIQIAAGRAIQEELDVAPRVLTPRERYTVRRAKRARERFFKANTRLLVSLANKYWTDRLKHMSIGDLVQEGAFGLNTAIERFDHTRGYKFSTYAYWWIRQSITRAIQYNEKQIRLPIGGINALNNLRHWVPEFTREHNRRPTLEEMAARCKCLPATLEGYLQHTNAVVSLDEEIKTAEDETLHNLAPSTAPGPEDYVEDLERQQSFTELFKHLLPVQREVMTLRYGLNGGESLSQREVGELIGKSKSVVGVLEKRSIKEIEDKAGQAIRFFSRHGWEVERDCA